jgi:nucleolar protein 4
VDRQSAQSIKDSEIAKRGKDKRNMYLANEGLILPVAETAAGAEDQAAAAPNKAAQNMSEADKEKRQRAQSEKRKKLQNPLFFVSGTRLSIRNLAKTVNDKELREICLNAAKNGIKKGLVKRADMEAYRAAQGNEFIQTQIQLHTKLKPNADLDAVPPAVGKSCLKNAKIMLDMQRIRGGAPQSRGYAFCEFTHHAHALAALRELNNNAAYSTHHSNSTSAAPADPNGGKLIVEFSLENIQKVCVLSLFIQL